MILLSCAINLVFLEVCENPKNIPKNENSMIRISESFEISNGVGFPRFLEDSKIAEGRA